MPDPAPLLVGSKEAARLLGISSRSLWSLMASGDIECVRCGRLLRYRPEALRQWVADHRMSGPGKHVNPKSRSDNGQFQRRQT